jgi:hypothetical protein
MIALDQSCSRPASRIEESGRFSSQAAEKRLAALGHGRCRRHSLRPSINKVFLLLFVHKKKPSPSLALAGSLAIRIAERFDFQPYRSKPSGT